MLNEINVFSYFESLSVYSRKSLEAENFPACHAMSYFPFANQTQNWNGQVLDVWVELRSQCTAMVLGFSETLRHRGQSADKQWHYKHWLSVGVLLTGWHCCSVLTCPLSDPALRSCCWVSVKLGSWLAEDWRWMTFDRDRANLSWLMAGSHWSDVWWNSCLCSHVWRRGDVGPGSSVNVSASNRREWI